MSDQLCAACGQHPAYLRCPGEHVDELATLRADLARVKAERGGFEDGLTIANNAAERRGRERDAACAQVRELQKVARAAEALRKTGKRAIDDPRGVLEEHAIDAVVDVFRAVDALPPSMLEEPSDG